MSASSKKKLRNAQAAEKMTEKQLAEQKEAKKLKIYTSLFVAVVALAVCFAIAFGVSNGITNSGLREKNTVALTVGDHDISNAEFCYFYIDAVNNYMNTYGDYAYLFGLDTTVPLNEQVANEETGATWADEFIDTAKANAQGIYALADAANKAGFTLGEEELASVDAQISNAKLYAQAYYGYSNLDQYLKASYGHGATEKSYRAYLEMNALARAYSSHYEEALTYDNAALRAADAKNPALYSAFSYNYYYVNANSFLTGGTTDEDGKTTYSDAEKAAAAAEAEKTAKALIEGITSVEELDAAIAALPMNAETTASSNAATDVDYDSVLSTASEWITASTRKAGDITYVPFTSDSTDSEGNSVTTTNGYYVIFFRGVNDNNFNLVNVRHILVSFEGGSYDSNTGVTTYTDEEKADAKAKAEQILADWKAGAADEASFEALANEKSADSNGSDGGLYTDVYPGQMVTAFNDWCFEEGRKAGDTGIVETQYGYHVIFFSGDSETLYRDYLIAEALSAEDYAAWANDLVDSMTVEVKDMKYIATDLVLSR